MEETARENPDSAHPATVAVTARPRGAPLRVVLSVTLALLCGPVLLDLAASPARRAFGYVASDTFYYLTVARNIARHGVPSFDGVHATNGFHPLWQAVCALVYFCAEHAGLANFVVFFVVLLGIALIAVGVSLLAYAFEEGGRLSPGFVVLPFGVYALLNTPVWSNHCLTEPSANIWNQIEGRLPLLGTLWSYANGMESALVLLGFGMLAYLYVQDVKAVSANTPRNAALFGAAAAFTTLSRLDHALLVAPILVAFVLRKTRRTAIAASAAFVAPIVLYLLVNRLWIGVAFPMSGAAKSTFPYYNADNLRKITEVWANVGVASARQDCWAFVVTYWREAQLCIPMIFGALYLLLTLRVSALPRGVALEHRERARPVERFLVPVALGVLLLGGYDFLFVPLINQGHWYFPISTLFVSLSVLAVLGRWRGVPNRVGVALVAACFCAGIFVFVKFYRSDEFHARFAHLYFDEGPKIRRRYAVPFKLVEFDDGIVAYSLDMPAMSATLMLDPQSEKAREKGSFFRLASARGFDRVSSFAYSPLNLRDLLKSPNGATEYARKFVGNETNAFDVGFDYVSENQEFAIVRMVRKRVRP